MEFWQTARLVAPIPVGLLVLGLATDVSTRCWEAISEGKWATSHPLAIVGTVLSGYLCYALWHQGRGWALAAGIVGFLLTDGAIVVAHVAMAIRRRRAREQESGAA